MMKKLLSALSLVFLLGSCSTELTYDGQTRTIFEGRVLDANGNALANIPVSVMVTKYGDREIISYGITDANGNYTLAYPDPINERNISLLINKNTPGKAANTALSNTEIYNIQWFNENDHKITFQPARLYEDANSVVLRIQPVFDNQILLKLNITGLVNEQMIDYNITKPVLDEEHVLYYEQFEKRVAKNQVVTLRYQHTNGTNAEAQVQINDENVEYQLQF